MPDQQDRRSQRTRQAVIEAFFELIKEKSYETITVSDIVARANVGRSTFYTHYRDKDDVLVGEFNHMIDVLDRSMPHEAREGNLFFPSLALFRHVGEQYELYKALSWGPGMDLMVKYVQKSLTKRIEQNLQGSGREFNVPIPTLANFVAGSFLALLKWWLENKMIHTPEQIDEIFRKLTMPGIKAGEIKS